MILAVTSCRGLIKSVSNRGKVKSSSNNVTGTADSSNKPLMTRRDEPKTCIVDIAKLVLPGSVSNKRSMYSIQAGTAFTSLPPIKDPPKINNYSTAISSTIKESNEEDFTLRTVNQSKRQKNAPALIRKKIKEKLTDIFAIPCRIKNYATKSIKGKSLNNPAKKNQDSYFLIRDFRGIKNVHLFGVLDGHGINGHLVSDYVKNRFPMHLELSEYKHSQAKSISFFCYLSIIIDR